MNNATKYVASRSRPSLEWSKSVLIEGDAAGGVAALKQQDGPDLQVHGSGHPGVMIGTFEPAGEIVTGSFALA